MVLSQKGRIGRKQTGGIYRSARKKRLCEMGRHPTHTKISEKDNIVLMPTKGNDCKVRVLEAHTVNLFDPKNKKFVKTDVKTVAENAANRHFVRRNIITKGSVITTSLGKAKVTSRPGQDGTVNAILL